MNKTIVISVLLILLALGGGFFAGMQYQKMQRPSFAANGNFAAGGAGANGQFRGRFGQGAGQNFRPVRGQVVSVDTNGLTVKLPDGSSKIVITSGSTTFVKSATGSKSDVATGDTVMVMGTQNSDGSVTAQDVQINPPAMNASPTAAPTKSY